MSHKRQREDKLSSESETERAGMLNFAHGLALSVTAAAVPPLLAGEALASLKVSPVH